ncbi:response regulator transcription factor [Pseudothauera rhizosphaerae]|uniref:Response regulator transcription factor n=1 Tax=Pseudothauera rhizosphaerae TaxID=2565932 RepID=A0A4S4AYW5_9RHOO|nr:response regulator transcription factor [Pseudothauera rhizosphaerae]THF65193.1 response regulator transcription factor [Pseudothauera rhizosphaerae]
MKSMESAAVRQARVLLVDDDAELLELLRDYLEGDGFAVDCVHDGIGGVAAALSGHHDIVVLDVMLPGLDGIQALNRIRASSPVPVLMLTARGDDTDRIVGLELGADDYVPKPCTPRELSARLKAILKRVDAAPKAEGGRLLVAGELRLRPDRRSAELGGVPLELTSTEFSLLETLVRHAGRPVGKQTLSEEALGRPLARFDRSIDVHISRIRHKLGTLADGRSRIQTVIRRGYQLIGE